MSKDEKTDRRATKTIWAEEGVVGLAKAAGVSLLMLLNQAKAALDEIPAPDSADVWKVWDEAEVPNDEDRLSAVLDVLGKSRSDMLSPDSWSKSEADDGRDRLTIIWIDAHRESFTRGS